MLKGGLFTRDFLSEGILGTEQCTALDPTTVTGIREKIAQLFASFQKFKNPTEADTEKELIWPLLEAVDWTNMLVQQNFSEKAREDVQMHFFSEMQMQSKSRSFVSMETFSAWKRFSVAYASSKPSVGSALSIAKKRTQGRKGNSFIPDAAISPQSKRCNKRWASLGILTNAAYGGFIDTKEAVSCG